MVQFRFSFNFRYHLSVFIFRLARVHALVEAGPDDDAEGEDGEAAHLRVGLQGRQPAPRALGPVEALVAQLAALGRAEVYLERKIMSRVSDLLAEFGEFQG